ncbi:hypothetical protein KTQ81_23910 [Salmonella enterica subsp. diarizonae]|uniref:hypothetical protein n=1 Tax=Salmonella enterica TaxID=28901 RepID=UPI001CF100BC|nr:hypothetical protein [Salmonella enterica subsp. diarizonae]
MENRNEILESFSWAALVAIKMAWRESNITSGFSEHVFIMSWLAGYGQKKETIPSGCIIGNRLFNK